MPSTESSYRRQDAVLWPFSGYDSYGQPTQSAPVELLRSNGTGVRWNSYFKERKDAQGNTIAIVGDVIVGREIGVGSLMWLGTLDDWYGVGSAGQDTGLCQVVEFNSTPDIKNRNSLRVATLMRWRGKVSG